MADGIRMADNGTKNVNGVEVKTPYEASNKKGVKVEDFLQLMIAQLTNQDFMNPTDDTQYVTQLAQFATMESMQELSHYSQVNYVSGLVGKTVTAASYGVGGKVNKEVGVVSKVDMSGDEFTFTVNGKQFTMSQIMHISDVGGGTSQSDLNEANKLSLITKDVGTNTISLRWPEALTDDDGTAGLNYDVYYTTNGKVDFNDLHAVKQGTKVASGIKGTEYTLSNLEPGTTYFVNVVVRNAKGDEAVYNRSVITTKNE